MAATHAGHAPGPAVVRIELSHAAAVAECLARSRSLRLAITHERQRAQVGMAQARTTLTECRQRGIELRVTPGPCGLPQLVVIHPERAALPLRVQIEACRAALVALLLVQQGTDGPASPHPVQGRLF